jgi:GlpG protein
MNADKLSDFTNYFSYNSVVILSFFFICLIVLIINYLLNNKVNEVFACRRGSIINPMTYIRMITCEFCHNDWEHFRNNFITILLIGPMLEEKYGSLNLVKMIIITTIVTSVIHMIISKKGAVGASDSVFMMITLASIVNITSGKIPITLILIFLFYVADEVIKQVTHKKDNISHESHVVGAILGIIFGYFIF